MSRILLADDSPQALRLAEQILSEQGIEIVSVTDGATALQRLSDVDPDLIITDVYLPTKNGFDLARYVKAQAKHKRVRIVFAAGIQDKFDPQDAKNAGADAILQKPFEASALLSTVRPLLEQATAERDGAVDAETTTTDSHSVRAAVTLALESATPVLIEELTQKVLLALTQQQAAAQQVAQSVKSSPEPEAKQTEAASAKNSNS